MFNVNTEEAGRWMYDFIRTLYPIPRSITGDGVRATLQRIGEHIPLDVHEVPSGRHVFDWIVPPEWTMRGGWIKDSGGETVVDFKDHNLHVMGYSSPVHQTMPLETLRTHCHTVPGQPDRIPYRTSYYKEQWAFCMTQRQLDALVPGDYEVFIDSILTPGSLTYGECILPGTTTDEFLISAHVCHPSLANDNLSGIALAVSLAKALMQFPHRYTYRFVFAPGTIGAITWLALNEASAPLIKHGLILACVGDSGFSTYKKSRRGNAEIDRAVAHVLQSSGMPYELFDFSPYGYDERQYCSPGFNLPVGCFMRTPPGKYDEYHTSADNLSLVRPEALADSFEKLLAVNEIIISNGKWASVNQKCEPQLGRRGLYGAIGGMTNSKDIELALLWVLNYSDGHHSLLDIAERSGFRYHQIKQAADTLAEANLIMPAHERG